MSYRRSWADLPEVPKTCPVCDGKHADADAVKVHNIRVAQTGERSYRWR